MREETKSSWFETMWSAPPPAVPKKFSTMLSYRRVAPAARFSVFEIGDGFGCP